VVASDITNNPNEIDIIVAFTFLIAGLVKGIIGIGLLTTAITIMTFFFTVASFRINFSANDCGKYLAI
jgi:uncharacterized membrane protein YfcA